MPAEAVELFLHQVGDGRFARAGETGEPEDPAPSAPLRGARRFVEVDGRASGRRRAAGRNRSSRRHGGVAEPVDEDEAAGVPVLPVGVEGDRAVQLQGAHADFVEPQGRPLFLLQGIDVDLVLERR